MNILVSACLLGVNCKYSGGNNELAKLTEHMKDAVFIPVCPEQLGGLTTPRLPAEIVQSSVNEVRIENSEGKDVTLQFCKGAEETLKIAKLYSCQFAILKERSPSCGSSQIYDGSFKGRVISGKGVTASLLEEHGIKVYSEDNFEELFNK